MEAAIPVPVVVAAEPRALFSQEERDRRIPREIAGRSRRPVVKAAMQRELLQIVDVRWIRSRALNR